MHRARFLVCFFWSCTKAAPPDAAPDTSTPVFTLPNAWDGSCPRPLKGYSGYCDNRCRTYGDRKTSHHSQRVDDPQRYGFGTCGDFLVFSEQDLGGIVTEYFDDAGHLVGATDDRRIECTSFGAVPSCDASVEWKVPIDPKKTKHGLFDDSRP